MPVDFTSRWANKFTEKSNRETEGRFGKHLYYFKELN
jgi:hypothetical protein